MDNVKKRILFFFLSVFFFSWFISIALAGPLYFDIVIFFFMFFIGGGLLGFLSSFSTLQDKKVLERTPLSKIRSIAMGRVQIQGKALPMDSVMKSPISNSDCMYYWAIVREENPSSKYKWKTLAAEKKYINFLLKDSTASVMVNPEKADIQISNASVNYIKPGEEIPANIRTFLEKNGVKLGFGRKLLMCTEYLIKPKDSMTVVGTASDNPHTEEATAVGSTEDIMIHHGNQWYAISDKPLQDVLADYGNNAKSSIGIGAIIIIFFLYCLIIHLDRLLAPKKWDAFGEALIQPTSAGFLDQTSSAIIFIALMLSFVFVMRYVNKKS
jgi:hypothetical protein